MNRPGFSAARSAVPDDLAAARCDSLDRARRTTNFFRHLDAPQLAAAKRKAHTAFVAYELAVRDGDRELAEAARQRFLDASAELSESRRAER